MNEFAIRFPNYLNLRKILLAGIVCATSLCGTRAGTVGDGDFVGWNLSSIGNGSMTLEAKGGNPGARLNATTLTIVGGPAVYDLAINSNFSSVASLSGSYTLELQVLSGPGDFGAGQSIGLLVQQQNDLYLQVLGITGSGHTSFDPLSFTGDFTAASFSHLSGAGSAAPDFSGGTPTYFGFAAINSNNNQSVTEYYDNFALTHVAVPEPSVVLFLGLSALGLSFARRRIGTR